MLEKFFAGFVVDKAAVSKNKKINKNKIIFHCKKIIFKGSPESKNKEKIKAVK